MSKHFTVCLCLAVTASLGLFAGAASYAAPAVVPQTAQTVLANAVTADTLRYARFDATTNNISIGADAYGKHLGLTASDGQKIKNSGVNSEIVIDYPYVEGDTVKYSWRMMIPAFLPADPENRWWLIARWTPQANFKIGEKQETYNVLNPAIMITYKLQENRDTFALGYGVPDTILADAFSVTRNEWVKVDLVVTWSTTSSGKAVMYINNSKISATELRGRNMYHKHYDLFRLGIFRSPKIQEAATILYGDISVEHVKP